MFKRAIELDSQYTVAYVSLGFTHLLDLSWLWDPSPRSLEQAFWAAQKAVTLDDSHPYPHKLLGQVYLLKKQHARAIAELERAITLDPSCADCYVALADILSCSGRPQEAIALIKKAMRLNPVSAAYYSAALGHAYFLMRRYEEAIPALKRPLTRNPNLLAARTYLAAVYSELGREEEGRAELVEGLKLSPEASLEKAKRLTPYKDPTVSRRLLEALHRLGL